MRRLLTAMASAWLVIAAAGALAAGQASAATFMKGFSEELFASPDAAVRNVMYDQSVAANANIARVNVLWDDVVGPKPAQATNPADPSYDFTAIDNAVRGAAARGTPVMLTLYHAPSWAEGANPPNGAYPGSWKPDVAAVGAFAEAVARRYSGSFDPGTGVLPHVRYYEAWNEPNLTQYLSPQYSGNRELAGVMYRKLLNAFYAGVKKVDRTDQVIAGATAPYGDDPPDAFRTRPLRFLRTFLCLKGDLHHLRAAACPSKPRFDILSHHPITLAHGPGYSAVSPWDAATADFHNVALVLHAAEAKHRVGTPGHHPLWATELWWESQPPDRRYGIPLQQHARYLEQAMYSLWRQGAQVMIWLQVMDHITDPDGFSNTQSGVLFYGGQQKPAFEAFRFPFVTQRRHGSNRVQAWAIPPTTGRVAIQRKAGGGWHTIASGGGRDGKVFQRALTLPGSATLRATVAGEASLSWKQGAAGGSGGGSRDARRSARSAPSPPAGELGVYAEDP